MSKRSIREDYDVILLQNLAIVEFLRAIHEDDFVNSKYFDDLNMNYQLKTVLKDIGINNTSSLLLMLFLLLTVTKELQAKGKQINLAQAQYFVHEKKIKFSINKLNLETNIDYIKVIRDSISHMNTHFTTIDGITFVIFCSRRFDKKTKSKNNVEFFMATKDVGKLIDIIYNSIISYLNKKYHE